MFHIHRPRANCCGELAAAQLIGKEFEPEDGEPLLCAMLKSERRV